MELRVREGGGRGLALGKLGLFFFLPFLKNGELCVELTVLSLGVKYRNMAWWRESFQQAIGNTRPSAVFLNN